jgi:predicted RNA-binding protein YlqC (UPF0109 family)
MHGDNDMAGLLDEVLVEDTTTDSLMDIQEPEEVVVEEELPEKYRGKTAKDIAKMHQDAEKLIGKQGSEVGELRRVVDDFIKTQTAKEHKTEETLVDDDFFVEPKSAVKKAIDNHPAIKEAQQASIQMRRAETVSKLESQFPNFMETVQDPDFADWIKGSRVRTELFTRAETQFDYDSAQELLATWQEKKEFTKKVTETSKLVREKQLKAADIGTTGTSEQVSKKKYRRSDIIKLMQTDPDRYDAMSNEIMAAYKEGRVI